TPLLRKGVDAASLRDADGNSLREFPKYGSYAGRWGLRDFPPPNTSSLSVLVTELISGAIIESLEFPKGI
ncbi:hypothetical protein, partial [Streptomyces tricolor]|uniref:hypothetical protein n=1 Tax=Streptomyces tricolor TaxID=68277 RepID=UPI003D741794